MKTPIVKSCLVFDLKTGGLIIGWLGVFNSIWITFVAFANGSFTVTGLACEFIDRQIFLVKRKFKMYNFKKM